MAEGTKDLRTGVTVSIKTGVCICQACIERKVTCLHASCIPEILGRPSVDGVLVKLSDFLAPPLHLMNS